MATSLIPSPHMCVLVAQSCLTLCDPVDCSPPGSSVHGLAQARILDFTRMQLNASLRGNENGARPVWSPPQEGSGPAGIRRGPGMPSPWGECREARCFSLLACMESRHLGRSGGRAPPGAQAPGLSGRSPSDVTQTHV